ncbi:argininosuccinate lyase [Roseivivax sp. CAU 1753]
MKVIAVAVLSCLALVACGADGAPERPGPKEDPPLGFSVTGSASVGVVSR